MAQYVIPKTIRNPTGFETRPPQFFTLSWEADELIAIRLSGEVAFSIPDLHVPITCLTLKQAIGEHVETHPDELTLCQCSGALENNAHIDTLDELVLHQKDREFQTIRFNVGPLGCDRIKESGLIMDVEKGQALDAGVRPGWRIVAIDGMPYDPDFMERRSHGHRPYLDITFEVEDEFVTSCEDSIPADPRQPVSDANCAAPKASRLKQPMPCKHQRLTRMEATLMTIFEESADQGQTGREASEE